MCLNLNENILSQKLDKKGEWGGVCLAFKVNMDLMELSHGQIITF